MEVEKRLSALVKLGEMMQQDELFLAETENAFYKNNWFVREFVQYAVNAIIGQFLQPDKLQAFAARYSGLSDFFSEKTLGIIMAGNLPLVGFHDFLCSYICGIKTTIKLSSRDDVLMQHILRMMTVADASGMQKMQLADRLDKVDLVIATGSNNTNRYFEQYFKHIPRLLRQSRYSVAVLNGSETDKDLQQLADDIFLYFNMGCRSVSHLFLPRGYNVVALFDYFKKYDWLHHHTKYMNNYDYLRAIYLLNKQPHFASEFLMLREGEAFTAAIAKLSYSFYDNQDEVEEYLLQNQQQLQLIASDIHFQHSALSRLRMAFGECQHPTIFDFADGADTIDFILSNGK